MLRLAQDQFDEIIHDTSKIIEGDISWAEKDNHYPFQEFRVEISSNANHPIFINGSYNSMAKQLTYALIHRSVGRIYALDLGKKHRNPDGTVVGEKHKHRWDFVYKDKKAYEPVDITASIDQPILVWEQFCVEAKIVHRGSMNQPELLQLDLFL